MGISMVAAVVVSVVLSAFVLKKLSASRARTYFYDTNNIEGVTIVRVRKPEEIRSEPEIIQANSQHTQSEQYIFDKLQEVKTNCEKRFDDIDKKIKKVELLKDIQVLDDMWNKSKVLDNTNTNTTSNTGVTDDNKELIQETLNALQRLSETLDRLSQKLQEEEQRNGQDDELDECQ